MVHELFWKTKGGEGGLGVPQRERKEWKAWGRGEERRERLRAPKNKPFHIVLHGVRKPTVSYGFSLYSWLPHEGTFKECQTREFYHICWWEGYSQHKGAEHFKIFLREALYLRTYLENSLEVEGETLGAWMWLDKPLQANWGVWLCSLEEKERKMGWDREMWKWHEVGDYVEWSGWCKFLNSGVAKWH